MTSVGGLQELDELPCLFLVVTGEKDRARVERLLVPFFSGAFHEIAPVTELLGPDEVEELHSTMTRYREVIGRFEQNKFIKEVYGSKHNLRYRSDIVPKGA